MQKKHMERCLFTLLVLLIFALTILGLYRVTKHSAAPASTTIPVVSPAASPADDPTANKGPVRARYLHIIIWNGYKIAGKAPSPLGIPQRRMPGRSGRGVPNSPSHLR